MNKCTSFYSKLAFWKMILPRFWWIGSSVCFSVVERGGGTNTPDIRIQPTSSCSHQTNGTRKRACERTVNLSVKVLVSQFCPTLCHPMDCFRETTENKLICRNFTKAGMKRVIQITALHSKSFIGSVTVSRGPRVASRREEGVSSAHENPRCPPC